MAGISGYRLAAATVLATLWTMLLAGLYIHISGRTLVVYNCLDAGDEMNLEFFLARGVFPTFFVDYVFVCPVVNLPLPNVRFTDSFLAATADYESYANFVVLDNTVKGPMVSGNSDWLSLFLGPLETNAVVGARITDTMSLQVPVAFSPAPFELFRELYRAEQSCDVSLALLAIALDEDSVTTILPSQRTMATASVPSVETSDAELVFVSMKPVRVRHRLNVRSGAQDYYYTAGETCNVTVPSNGARGACPQTLMNGESCGISCAAGYHSIGTNVTCFDGSVNIQYCVGHGMDARYGVLVEVVFTKPFHATTPNAFAAWKVHHETLIAEILSVEGDVVKPQSIKVVSAGPFGASTTSTLMSFTIASGASATRSPAELAQMFLDHKSTHFPIEMGRFQLSAAPGSIQEEIPFFRPAPIDTEKRVVVSPAYEYENGVPWLPMMLGVLAFVAVMGGMYGVFVKNEMNKPEDM